MKVLDCVSSLFGCRLFLGHFLRIFDGAYITLVIIIVDLLVLLALLTINHSNFISIRLLYIIFNVIGMNF